MVCAGPLALAYTDHTARTHSSALPIHTHMRPTAHTTTPASVYELLMNSRAARLLYL